MEVTHLNLNDGSCAGLAYPQRKLMSLQYHPEASPGPHDSDPGKCTPLVLLNSLIKVLHILHEMNDIYSTCWPSCKIDIACLG